MIASTMLRWMLLLLAIVVLVVSISAQTRSPTVVRRSSPAMLSGAEIARRTLPSVVLVSMYDASGRQTCFGSGFFVAPGVILTNKHVVTCGDTGRGIITLRGDNIQHSIARIVTVAEDDLALVEVGGITRPALVINSSSRLAEGDDIYVAGNPEGLESTFTRGIISSVRSDARLLQYDATAAHGSSGGPVVDRRGLVVGIATSGMEGKNFNFAIPASRILPALTRMQAELVALRRGGREVNPRLTSVAAKAATDSRSGVGGNSPRESSTTSATSTKQVNFTSWRTWVWSQRDFSSASDLAAALKQTGIDINQPDEQGDMLLHFVSRTDEHKELLIYLLLHGAHVNATDKDGATPLMHAVRWQAVENVRALLAANADVNLADKQGITALHLALTKEMDELLWKSGRVAKGYQCQLRAGELQAMRGFRLGMTPFEVVQHFRGVQVPMTDVSGWARLSVPGMSMLYLREMTVSSSIRAELVGVHHIGFDFVDGKLASLKISYDASVKWRTSAEYLEAVRRGLGISGVWRPTVERLNREYQRDDQRAWFISCDGFSVVADSGSFMHIFDPQAEALVARRRAGQVEGERRRAETTEQNRRQDYKP